MIRQVIIILFLTSSFIFTQPLQVVLDANIHNQNDPTHTNQFAMIITKLITSLENDKIEITKQRINEKSLSIKQRLNLLDSLHSDLYISISGDIKNDSQLNAHIENTKRGNPLSKANPQKSHLDILFQSEFNRLSGKSIPDSSEIFYPIISIQKEKRLTHMALDLKPIMNTLINCSDNDKLIEDIFKDLNACIMQYIRHLP